VRTTSPLPVVPPEAKVTNVSVMTTANTRSAEMLAPWARVGQTAIVDLTVDMTNVAPRPRGW
jgi:hypothetical protein